MMDDTICAIVVIALVVVGCMIFGGRACLSRMPKSSSRMVHRNIIVHTNQQEDIFNISSRVQGQGQWPTHDAHVSLDHFAITNEINKYNDDPPTYEEAMNIAASNNNNTVVPAVVPKTTITPSSTTTTTTTTSTSTSAAN
ncbi:uncharacterized protein LOC135134590 isoform X10 [Zophobas morio]|uniref:uncharacterized protein LOC135134590 isoform X10 n=1 Tax=Zophobas morio TaxID=2755281 RepID=UPI003082A568